MNIDEALSRVEERRHLLELAKRMRDSVKDYEGDHPLSLTGHDPFIYALGLCLATLPSLSGRELILSEVRARQLLLKAAQLQQEELDELITVLERDDV